MPSMVKIFFILIIFQLQLLAAPQWEQIRCNYGSSVSSMEIDREGDLFLSPEYNGIIRYDLSSGESSGIFLPSTNVNEIAVTNKNTILAGTYDGFYRSEDKGNTWDNIKFQKQFYQIQRIFEDDNGDLYAVNGSLFYQHNQGHIVRSTDDGKSWNTFLQKDVMFTDIAKTQEGDFIAGTYGEGFLIKQNNEENWEPMNEGLEDHLSVVKLIVTGENKIYSCVSRGSATAVNLYSFDKVSSSWKMIKALSSTVIYDIFENNSGNIFIATESDGLLKITKQDDEPERCDNDIPNAVSSITGDDNGNLIAGSVKGILYGSTDNGNTWEYTDQAGCFTSDMQIRNNGDIWVGNDNGLFIKKSGSEFFEKEDKVDMSVKEIYKHDENNYFLNPSCCTNSLHIDTENEKFTKLTFLGSCMASARNGVIYGGSSNGIYVSTDNGETWKSKNTSQSVGSKYITHLANNGKGRTLLVSSMRQIIEVSNAGNNYELIYQFDDNYRITDIITNEEGDFFISTQKKGFYKLDLSKKSVEKKTGIIQNARIADLEVSSAGTIAAAANDGVFMSTDKGNSWQQVNSGLKNLNITKVRFDNENRLYAASTGKGLYRTIYPLSVEEESVRKDILKFKNPYHINGEIMYNAKKSGHTKITVNSVTGKQEAVLYNGHLEPGMHSYYISNELLQGNYFINIINNEGSYSKQLLIIK